jgi:hypothetical protein
MAATKHGVPARPTMEHALCQAVRSRQRKKDPHPGRRRKERRRLRKGRQEEKETRPTEKKKEEFFIAAKIY